MLKIIENGNIFNSNCDFLVNPVNTVGIMGKGLALEFKKKFPNNFIKYQKFCKDNSFGIGKLLIVKENNKSILNFPTKKHWKNKSELDYIIQGLEKLKIAIEKYNINSVAFPKIGCGLGGLDWNIVLDLLINFEKNISFNILVEIYL